MSDELTGATSKRWSLERGACVLADGRTRFSVWAPKASRVAVAIAGGAEHEMAAAGGGVFEAVIADGPAGTDYRYRLDDQGPLPDPVSRWQPHGVHGASRVVDPSAFQWSDASWTGLEMADLVIYELHVGTFSPEGTFDGVIPQLARLRELGITALEIMPVAEFPGARNWGYDGAHPYAAQSTYGGPEGLRRLVDAAHVAGLAVILDVVYNHLGPEGNYLGAYAPYFTEAYRTPWGGALNYDDRDSDEVRRYFIDNALHWITDYHLDGLRLDAVQAIVDLRPVHVLAELSEAVSRQAAALGRRVVLIGESDLNDPKVVRPPEQYGWGLDAQWSDDLHHALHAHVTGERTAYYADFGSVRDVATALRTPFVPRWSAHYRRRYGASAEGIPRDRFVVYAQNHDQVGNRARGDRLSTLVSPAMRRVVTALVLLSAYVPMLFMGDEYGETNPFLYFTSHGDAQLGEAVRKGRERDLARFRFTGDVPDPQAARTFERSRLAYRDDGEHGTTLALHRALLRLRRAEPALRPGGADVRVAHDDAGWIGMELIPAARGREVAVLLNLSGAALDVPLADAGSDDWRLLLHTGDAAFGGGEAAPRLAPDPSGGARVRLGAQTAAVFARGAA